MVLGLQDSAGCCRFTVDGSLGLGFRFCQVLLSSLRCSQVGLGMSTFILFRGLGFRVLGVESKRFWEVLYRTGALMRMHQRARWSCRVEAFVGLSWRVRGSQLRLQI